MVDGCDCEMRGWICYAVLINIFFSNSCKLQHVMVQIRAANEAKQGLRRMTGWTLTSCATPLTRPLSAPFLAFILFSQR